MCLLRDPVTARAPMRDRLSHMWPTHTLDTDTSERSALTECPQRPRGRLSMLTLCSHCTRMFDHCTRPITAARTARSTAATHAQNKQLQASIASAPAAAIDHAQNRRLRFQRNRDWPFDSIPSDTRRAAPRRAAPRRAIHARMRHRIERMTCTDSTNPLRPVVGVHVVSGSSMPQA